MSAARILVAIGVMAVSSGPGKAAAWLSNFEAAKSQASATGRPILISFGGSDWCPDCNTLRSQVLDATEFREFANAHLVLLEVDIPRHRPVAALQKQVNDQLLRKYGVTAFPTLILAKGNGDPIGNVKGAGSGAQLAATLNQTLARVQGRGTRSSGGSASAQVPPVGGREPVRDSPLFGGAATQPLPVYSNLVVKSISGPPTRRFALINSETLAVGDTTWLKVGDQRVSVQCVEIREKSVLLRVAGEPRHRELHLSDIRR